MRLVVLSAREIDTALYWRNLAPPLEEALAAKPGSTLVAAPPFRRPSLSPRRPAWLAAIRTVRKADAVFWIQHHDRPPTPVWALAYVKPGARRATLTIDTYPQYYWKLALHARAQRLSHSFIDYRQSVMALKATAPNRNFEWLPNSFNDRVFREHGLERDIYALWIGRRYEPFHEALLAHCSRRGLRYEYFEPPGLPVPLDELSRLTARSRYFVTMPRHLENPTAIGGLSPLTMRYLEGTGAGCRLLGALPLSGEFELFLPRDAIVECSPDGSDLADVLEEADADPSFETKAAAACEHAHAHHPWPRRAEAIHSRLLGGPEQPLDRV